MFGTMRRKQNSLSGICSVFYVLILSKCGAAEFIKNEIINGVHEESFNHTCTLSVST